MDTKERIKNTFSEVGAMNGTNGTEMTNKSNEIMDKLVNDGEIKEMKASKKRVSKKIEATETTSSSSSGAFSGPAIWAKDEKNWRGAAKPIYKGGKFVTVKNKCKKFPYCNQGEFKSIKIFENSLLKEVIREISDETGIMVEEIEKILKSEIVNQKSI